MSVFQGSGLEGLCLHNCRSGGGVCVAWVDRIPPFSGVWSSHARLGEGERTTGMIPS